MRHSVPSIRLFISSTFKDLTLERNELKKTVFPRLRALCERYGARFQAVDLRWGINEEAALDQRTIEICLEELQRCQEISPVPNFLLLLGDRYGWQPLPLRIHASEFGTIVSSLRLARVPERRLAKLTEWYRVDENWIPPHFCLKPRGRRHRAQAVWEKVEGQLRPLLRQGARLAGISGAEAEKYFLSATAQEITRGVFAPPEGVPDVRQHVFCFSRTFQTWSDTDAAGARADYFDTNKTGEIDAEAQDLLHALRTRLKDALGENIHSFSVPWSEHADRAQFLRFLAEESYQGLAAVIERDLKRLQISHPDVAERRRHLEFQATRLDGFHGRDAELGKLCDFVAGDSTAPLLVLGQGGSGKSSLMALASHILSSKVDACKVVVRFIGTTGASGRFDSLIESISGEILSGQPALSVEAPAAFDAQGWSNWFLQLESAAGDGERIVLLIDALDQLSSEDQGRLMEWLPVPLPPRLRIILSAIPSPSSRIFEKRYGKGATLSLGTLAASDGEFILEAWLKKAGRTLQPAQFAILLKGFNRQGLPLYLKLAFREAVRWRSYERGRLPVTLAGIINSLLNHLEREDQHGKIFTRKALSYLSASRNGLAEEELLDLLSADHAVMHDFARRFPAAARVEQLPFTIWARLHGDFRDYLAERGADGRFLYAFYHRIIGEQINRRYLCRKEETLSYHRNLADYFHNMPTWLGEGTHRQPNLRKLSEAPYHLKELGDHRRLLGLLEDTEYREAKLKASRKYEWLEEIDSCFDLAGADDKEAVLEILIRHVEALGGIVNPFLSLEEIHGFFVYRKSPHFHAALISYGAARKGGSPAARALQLGFLARQANKLRRDGELDKAVTLLQEVVNAFDEQKELQAERGRAEYDLGYVHYLRGEFEEAKSWLSRSAETSSRADSEGGYWISSLVAAHVEVMAALGTETLATAAGKFRRRLEQAESFFRAGMATDTTAERWMMNVRAHRFEIAYLLNEIDAARDCYLALEGDAWLRRFGNEEILRKARGRLALLEGNGAEAVSALRRGVPTSKSLKEVAGVRAKEALAWDMYDLGRAEELLGNAQRARRVWSKALTLPADAGNKPWQTLIRRELRGKTGSVHGHR